MREMRDVDYSDDDTPYECFSCGTIVVAESHPDKCPDCGGRMRNRMVSFE